MKTPFKWYAFQTRKQTRIIEMSIFMNYFDLEYILQFIVLIQEYFTY